MQLLGRPEAVLLCILRLAALGHPCSPPPENIRPLKDGTEQEDRQEILSRDANR
jgi:hypothetical protein